MSRHDHRRVDEEETHIHKIPKETKQVRRKGVKNKLRQFSKGGRFDPADYEDDDDYYEMYDQ